MPAISAASRAVPSFGCRTAMTSAYCSTVRIVSENDSPLAVEEFAASEKPITRPPSRHIADSKLSRVRVLGSKNSVARIFPGSRPAFSALGNASTCAARSR